MAAKTPVAFGTSGYVDPISQLPIGPLTTAQGYIANGTVGEVGRYTRQCKYFSDIDDGDTWASGLPIVACAWQGNTLADAVQATCDSAGLVTFETTSTSNLTGYLHYWLDDPQLRYGKRVQ